MTNQWPITNRESRYDMCLFIWNQYNIMPKNKETFTPPQTVFKTFYSSSMIPDFERFYDFLLKSDMCSCKNFINTNIRDIWYDWSWFQPIRDQDYFLLTNQKPGKFVHFLLWWNDDDKQENKIAFARLEKWTPLNVQDERNCMINDIYWEKSQSKIKPMLRWLWAIKIFYVSLT